jgi:hypothetical protein
MDKGSVFASHRVPGAVGGPDATGIDALVVPQIEEVDYRAFRALIKLLPSSYDAWRNYHEPALRKRGADAGSRS